MESKYYTPEIEEFHVGFEFEVYEDYDVLSEKSWHKETYPSDTASQFYINEGLLRVKYLDREDIESLGFEYDGLYNDKNARFKRDKVEITLYNELVIIVDESNELLLNVKFQGTIKNKSELKKILKQIGYEKGYNTQRR